MTELDPNARIMLFSLLGLGLLHMLMFIWLYATRIPAMISLKIKPGTAEKTVLESLPNWARNPQANYNHLSEAPTTFYATVIVLILLGQADAINAHLSLAYLGLRVLHSLVQATVNIILVRWLLFIGSMGVLGYMIIRGLLVGHGYGF